MAHRHRSGVLLLALVAAMVVAACGSSSKSSSGGAATPSGPKSSPIVIGNIGSYSGVSSQSDDPGRAAIQSWANWTNAHGGINGHPVKLFVLDDASSPTTAVSDAKQLVEQDHVIALVGNNDNEIQSYASYLQQQKVPVVGGEADSPVFLTNPYLFSTNAAITTSVYMQLAVSKDAGAKGFGSFYCAEVPSCAQAVPLFQAASKATGLPVVYTSKYAAGSPDYTAICLAAKNHNADAVALDGNGIQKVVDSCAGQGYKPIWVVPSGAYTTTLLKDANFAQALVPLEAFPWFVNNATTANFHAALQQYAPGQPLGQGSSFAWNGGTLFTAAATKAGGVPTSQSLVAALRTLNGTTLGGLTPPLQFSTTGGPNPPNTCYYTAKIVNSQLTAPKGLTYSCVNVS